MLKPNSRGCRKKETSASQNLLPRFGTEGAVDAGAGAGAIGCAGEGYCHHDTPKYPTLTVDRLEGESEGEDGPEVQDSDLVSAVEGAIVAAAEDVVDAVRKDVGGGGRSNWALNETPVETAVVAVAAAVDGGDPPQVLAKILRSLQKSCHGSRQRANDH